MIVCGNRGKLLLKLYKLGFVKIMQFSNGHWNRNI